MLSGSVFGPSTYIDLRLLDMPICIQKLEGVKLEIEDSCYDLLDNLVLTADPREAFVGCEVAILLGNEEAIAEIKRIFVLALLNII